MQAKKTTKKTAKKTYPSTKKKLPKLKSMTLEEFIAVTSANHAKTEAAIRKLSAENRKKAAEAAEIKGKALFGAVVGAILRPSFRSSLICRFFPKRRQIPLAARRVSRLSLP